MNKWDKRFLRLAKHVAGWSKDPSTKVGAVIARGNRQISMGYNGFPMFVNDSADRYTNRDLKYQMIIHAEVNAILFAKTDLTASTIYTWPFPPCCRCAAQIIQSGITTIVALKPTPELFERWGNELTTAYDMYLDAGIDLKLIEEEI